LKDNDERKKIKLLIKNLLFIDRNYHKLSIFIYIFFIYLRLKKGTNGSPLLKENSINY